MVSPNSRFRISKFEVPSVRTQFGHIDCVVINTLPFLLTYLPNVSRVSSELYPSEYFH